jgi:hypothetical protein
MDVFPYSVPASSGMQFAAGSSIERIAPSDTAMPRSMDVTVVAMDCDSKRSWWVRP